MANKNGDLRIWWIPQVPMKAFCVEVGSIKEAKLILNTLGEYDNFQFKNNVKPDYCNTGGLEVWEDNYDGEGTCGWVTWYSEDGLDIDEVDNDGNELGE
jgi:hypothetical protein